MKKPIVRYEFDRTVIKHGGVLYEVPSAFKVIADELFQEKFTLSVEQQVMGQGPGIDYFHFFVGKKEYRAFVFGRAGVVRVAASPMSEKLMCWARFREKDGALEEELAAVLPEYRRKGVYTALLRELKKKWPVIYSDKTLSVSNALRWMRTGTYDATKGRFRLNPVNTKSWKPSKTEIKKALLALGTRWATQ